MKALEKTKINEIQAELYQLNQFIGIKFIHDKKELTNDDFKNISDTIARCIRQLRGLI